MQPPADIDEIRRALELLIAPEMVAELRIPGTHRGTISGYYSDREALARDAVLWSGKAAGVYVTLNPVLPDLLARSCNAAQEYCRHTTQDEHITFRRWIAIDFDAERPAGISASDEEHALALQRAADCRAWLLANGWPGVVLADSGNGGHLLARVDLPNDEGSRALLERCLAALKAHYADGRISVDQKVANASRIWKLYGTLAAKGSSIPTRPHRLARILDLPPLGIVPEALLQGLAARAAQEPARTRPAPARAVSTAAAPAAPSGRGDYATLDVVRWFTDHGAYRQATSETGKHWVECPWLHEHSTDAKGDTAIWEADGGWPTFHCFHDHCHGRTLQSVMELWGDADSYCAETYRSPAAWPTTHRPNGNGSEPARIPEHARIGSLTEQAGALRRQALEEDEIAASLLAINARRCDPPLPEEEIRAIAAKVCRFEPTEAAAWRILGGEKEFTGLDPLRRIQTDPPTYEATVRGRPVRLSLLELSEFKRFKLACLQQLNYLPELPAPDARAEKMTVQVRWEREFVAPAVERMDRLSMIEDAPEDAGVRGATWDDVISFIRTSRVHETKEDLGEDRLTLIDGAYTFKGIVLRRWLAKFRLDKLPPNELWGVVREHGGTSGFVWTPKGSVRVWKIPNGVTEHHDPQEEREQ